MFFGLSLPKFIASLVVSLFLVAYSFSPTSLAMSTGSRPVVAITQIAPHPSLDEIRRGIEDELKAQKIDADLLFENAQGNIAIATQIGQKFVSLKPTVIVPITTPSTQAIYSVAKAQGIPVVFAAVSDPVGAKLVSQIGQAGEGITGISDLSPIAEQISLMQTALPQAKTLGIIYNPGEANSETLVRLLEQSLPKTITLIKAPAINTTDVSSAVKNLASKKVDMIYLPNDNTVVSALNTILQSADEYKIPVFSADPESVKRGCLATVAHSQYQLGRETGVLVAKVLKGENVNTLPIERPKKVEISLNLSVAKKLGIVFPDSLLKQADHKVS